MFTKGSSPDSPFFSPTLRQLPQLFDDRLDGVDGFITRRAHEGGEVAFGTEPLAFGGEVPQVADVADACYRERAHLAADAFDLERFAFFGRDHVLDQGVGFVVLEDCFSLIFNGVYTCLI